MNSNPLVGQLFSKDGAAPVALPDRVHLGGSTAYLNAEADLGNEYTADDLAEYGYIGPIELPFYDMYRQSLVWDGTEYVATDLSDEAKETLWASGAEDLNNRIQALQNQAELRKAQLLQAGVSTAAVDAFNARLLAAEASSSCPMEVVLPSPAMLNFENSAQVAHPLAIDWCKNNWVSDIDRGYMATDDAVYFYITNEETFLAYLEAHKEEINIYALGQEFQALVYPVQYTDNFDRTASVVVELGGDAIGYTYSIDGGSEVIMSDDELSFDISGSGEHIVSLSALSESGTGKTFDQTFFIQ